MRLGLDNDGNDDDWEDGKQFFPEMVDAMNKIHLLKISSGQKVIFFIPTDEPESEKVQPPNDETEKVQSPNADSEKVQPSNDDSEKVKPSNDDSGKVQPPTDETGKVQPPTGKAKKVHRCESSSRPASTIIVMNKLKEVHTVFVVKDDVNAAMLVHHDKNMGSALASESFKKIQCAYEVLSDSLKKRDYDEQLRKKESKSLCDNRQFLEP
nr:hypothetical protein [Tanacetum cinerariifolium]